MGRALVSADVGVPADPSGLDLEEGLRGPGTSVIDVDVSMDVGIPFFFRGLVNLPDLRALGEGILSQEVRCTGTICWVFRDFRPEPESFLPVFISRDTCVSW